MLVSGAINISHKREIRNSNYLLSSVSFYSYPIVRLVERININKQEVGGLLRHMSVA